MFRKSESNNSQNSIHADLEESKAKRDSISYDLPKKSIKIGSSPLIQPFYVISIFHSSKFFP